MMLFFLMPNELHTSIIRWENKLVPRPDKRASGTPQNGNTSSTRSQVPVSQLSGLEQGRLVATLIESPGTELYGGSLYLLVVSLFTYYIYPII